MNHTPQKRKTCIVKRIANCDSPLRFLPNISTPPSRFTRIFNPFERHMTERVHLPTFSPSVFTQTTTHKVDEKFKWTIEDISNLKPADIDEETITQHICDEDPTSEVVVQEKITRFFNDKVIVPSPMTCDVRNVALVDESPELSPSLPQFADSAAQTVLTLPPIIPIELEEALKPYFTYTEDQQNDVKDQSNSSLYRKLFDFGDHDHDQENERSMQSSPSILIGSPPVLFSPFCGKTRTFDSPLLLPQLRECNLSPITGSPRESKSAYTLSVSGHMSIDASSVVPDINEPLLSSNDKVSLEQNNKSVCQYLTNSAIHWDMEYQSISTSAIENTCPNSRTPHSKLFTSQRKRLTESFRDDDGDSSEFSLDEDEEMETESPKPPKYQLTMNITDSGYQTGSVVVCDDSTWNKTSMFASTPAKR